MCAVGRYGDQDSLVADDVIQLASDYQGMRIRIGVLEALCRDTGMNVNLSKTRWMSGGVKQTETVL